MTNYIGVTFQNGKKEIFIFDKFYTYKNEHDAKINSMDFSFTRYEHSDGMKWRYFYRGNEVKITMIRTDRNL